jgi:transmembrane sensor
MDPSDRITYLLNRYLDNTCTRQEMDELLDYIQEHAEDEHLRAALEEGWEAENFFTDAGEPGWTEMQKKLQDLPGRENVRCHERLFFKAAACVLFLTAFCAAFFFWTGNKNESFVENLPVRESVKTSEDEHRLIVLSDGSKVWINGNSKLSCAPAFNDRTREVALDGEAFFDIRHDPDRPFIIKTGDVKTTVLGTAFNIRAFPGENAVTVTVTRGKVHVEAANNKGGTITANQQITLDLRSEQLEAQAVDADVVSQWIKDDLILYEVTLDEVEEILEERYSVEIVLDNALLTKCRFTSTFFQNASLDEVLTAICLVNGAEYKTDGKVITIYGQGCDEKK